MPRGRSRFAAGAAALALGAALARASGGVALAQPGPGAPGGGAGGTAASPRGGEVRPPPGVDPGIHAPVPAPDPGTTRVIPPPERVEPEPRQRRGAGAPDRGSADAASPRGGEVRPPPGVDPGIHGPVPAPDPGTTRVVPPPGTRGGDPSVQPR
jgi:hypothetical protein